MSYISVDVDLDDVIDGLSKREKQELADDFFKDGIVAKADKRIEPESDFDKLVFRFIGNKHKLSLEDEQTIINIANKIIV